ncbi:MAG TPA: hypothetical protein VMW58_06395 [Anaerolineae bacterium]|nr:hypothetical protein [Anaerolineae bacterium]
MNRLHNTRHLARVRFVLTFMSACMLLLFGCLDTTSEPAGTATPAPTSSPPGWTGKEPFYDLRDLALTPDGTVWAATGDGLLRLQGDAWESVLEGKEANALAVGPDGSLLVGVGGQVQRFDGASWETVFTCGEYLPRGKVLDIEFTPDGVVWIANGFGLASFDGQGWTTYDRLINSLVVAPDGALWMNGWEGTRDSFYIARFDWQRWTTYRGADSYPGGLLVGAVTPDGLLWGTVGERRLASFDGLSWGDEESWTVHPSADGFALDEVLTMAVGPDGALWVGTTSGAARFDGTWTPYATGHAVRAIAFGPEGEVWLGTTVIHPAGAK